MEERLNQWLAVAMVAHLVVAPDEDRQDRGDLLSRVVLVECLHCSVLWWAGHPGQVGGIAHRLKVTADK